MRELIYYVLAAVGGGIMAEINSENKNKTIRSYFIRGFTSVMIGVIFGLLFKEVTGNVNITIAITAVAGVAGMPSVDWLTKMMKNKAEKTIDTNPPQNG